MTVRPEASAQKISIVPPSRHRYSITHPPLNRESLTLAEPSCASRKADASRSSVLTASDSFLGASVVRMGSEDATLGSGELTGRVVERSGFLARGEVEKVKQEQTEEDEVARRAIRRAEVCISMLILYTHTELRCFGSTRLPLGV